MKNDGPIALRYDTRPVDYDANSLVEDTVTTDTNHSRFCSHAILQQLQVRKDLFSPEADIEMGDRITVSSYPNDAMEI